MGWVEEAVRVLHDRGFSVSVSRERYQTLTGSVYSRVVVRGFDPARLVRVSIVDYGGWVKIMVVARGRHASLLKERMYGLGYVDVDYDEGESRLEAIGKVEYYQVGVVLDEML